MRELDHAVERAVLLCQGDTVAVWDLALAPPGAAEAAAGQKSLEVMEREAIREALDRAGGNVSVAAKALGVSRSALYRRLQRYGL